MVASIHRWRRARVELLGIKSLGLDRSAPQWHHRQHGPQGRHVRFHATPVLLIGQVVQVRAERVVRACAAMARC